jgi:hypothetical protein
MCECHCAACTVSTSVRDCRGTCHLHLITKNTHTFVFSFVTETLLLLLRNIGDYSRQSRTSYCPSTTARKRGVSQCVLTSRKRCEATQRTLLVHCIVVHPTKYDSPQSSAHNSVADVKIRTTLSKFSTSSLETLLGGWKTATD